MTPRQPFRLTAADRMSPPWLAIEAEPRAQLDQARTRNDAPLSPEDTARLRGDIARIKQCLAWADEPPTWQP